MKRVPETSNSNLVLVSKDLGNSWSNHTNVMPQFWSSMSSSANATRMYATAKGGLMTYSTDSGTTWALLSTEGLPTDGLQLWYSITSSDDGNSDEVRY
jgi:photosystem II stability/assembly factor-like uncharacterized protein